MNAKDKIWQYLITHNNQATNAELANWLRGQPGQLSIGQRLRDIRKELVAIGGSLECKEIKTGIYLYTVIKSTEKPASIFTEPNGQMAFIGEK